MRDTDLFVTWGLCAPPHLSAARVGVPPGPIAGG